MCMRLALPAGPSSGCSPPTRPACCPHQQHGAGEAQGQRPVAGQQRVHVASHAHGVAAEHVDALVQVGGLLSYSPGRGDPRRSWVIRHQGPLLQASATSLPGPGGSPRRWRGWTRSYCLSDPESRLRPGLPEGVPRAAGCGPSEAQEVVGHADRRVAGDAAVRGSGGQGEGGCSWKPTVHFCSVQLVAHALVLVQAAKRAAASATAHRAAAGREGRGG